MNSDVNNNGLGCTSSGGSSSNILLEVDVPIDDSCGNYSNSDITNNMVCVMVMEMVVKILVKEILESFDYDKF